MSQPSDEEMSNNIIAAGGLMALLIADNRVDVVSVVGNTLLVRFPFLRSPYRITVVRETEEGLDDENLRTWEHDNEVRRRRARDCRTCNGPRSRETKGLVCQTCGWDYGKDGEP